MPDHPDEWRRVLKMLAGSPEGVTDAALLRDLHADDFERSDGGADGLRMCRDKPVLELVINIKTAKELISHEFRLATDEVIE